MPLDQLLNTIYEFFINNLLPSLPGLLGASDQVSSTLASPITSLLG